MKRTLLILAFMAAALGLESPARAAFIVGTQGYSYTSATSSGAFGANDIDNNLFTINFVANITPGSQTGDYIGTTGSFTDSFDVTSLVGFEFGNPSIPGGPYGTFTVSAVNVNTLTPNVARVINLSGIFTPFPLGFGVFSPTPGILSITINQASIPGNPNTLSASATLSTFAPAVPEPASIILLGTFLAPAAAGLWVRRRRTSRTK